MSGGNERLSGKERAKFIEQVAKNPIPILRNNIARGKTCNESIDFLRKVRTELEVLLAQKPARKISNIHRAFKEFYVHGDGDVAHHTGLFSILKDAGFNRNDIESALMDNMPIGKKAGPQKVTDASKRSETVREYITLTQSALDRVFATIN